MSGKFQKHQGKAVEGNSLNIDEENIEQVDCINEKNRRLFGEIQAYL